MTELPQGKAPRNVLITGASSGLGEALALAYAGPGVTLFLGGRDPQRTEATAAACRARGAQAIAAVVDVTNRDDMAAWVVEADHTAALDLVVANAGISAGTGSQEGESGEQTRTIFATNLAGVFNTVLPVIDSMRSRGHGQIALIASLAGFRGIPSSPAYCASKAAVRVWGEGLRGWLADQGIGVTVVCPGFVATRMTAVNRFPMPFLLSAEEAARRIKRGIDANRARVSFPWPLASVIWLLTTLPPAWTDRLLRHLPRKG